jgi:hypothetical protein
MTAGTHMRLNPRRNLLVLLRGDLAIHCNSKPRLCTADVGEVRIGSFWERSKLAPSVPHTENCRDELSAPASSIEVNSRLRLTRDADKGCAYRLVIASPIGGPGTEMSRCDAI